MAIYQFHLTVVPRKGLIEMFGLTPQTLDFEIEKELGIHPTNELDTTKNADASNEATIRKMWLSTGLKAIEVVDRIDQKLERANWGNHTSSIEWKLDTGEIDNDAFLSINPDSGKIEEFTFRADLRENDLKFLREMIEIGKDFDWLLMDVKGNLVNPEIEEILRLIENSNSFRFIQNPAKFLRDLEQGKIEME